jgi:outer membrane lipoprotein LolB
LLLAGCTSNPALTGNQTVSQHRKEVMAIERWRLNGKISIRTPSENTTAYLGWDQSPKHYDLQLTGPFGQGGARIYGSATSVRLTYGNDTLQGHSPEDLLYQTVGWTAPVSQLRYWVLGVPASPSTPVKTNRQGLPQRFSEGGWQAEIESWQTIDGVTVPRKAVFTRGDVIIRLVTSSWSRL